MTDIDKSKNIKEVELPAELSLKLDSIIPDPKKREQLKKVFSVFISRSYSGALPPPEMLKQFEEVLPGLAERLVSRMEKQSDHRMKLEGIAVPAQLSESKRGQWLGFIVSVLFLGASVWLALEGHDTVAGILGGSTIVGLVTIFVVGKRQQKREFSESK